MEEEAEKPQLYGYERLNIRTILMVVIPMFSEFSQRIVYLQFGLPANWNTLRL